MSKPKNNRVMCPDCGRAKMLFDSERKAKDFIKWNGGDINTHGGELRPYYCPACCGWHITSKPYEESYDHRTENLIGAFNRSVAAGKVKIKYSYRDIQISNMLAMAKDIWDLIPLEVKNNGSKKKIGKYVTEYLSENGIKETDGGCMRKKVYDMWEAHNYENRDYIW